jgi:hypothetical protein
MYKANKKGVQQSNTGLCSFSGKHLSLFAPLRPLNFVGRAIKAVQQIDLQFVLRKSSNAEVIS